MTTTATDSRKNASLAVSLLALVVGMVGLSFAAVPLYDLFCKVTGFGGTVQKAQTASPQLVAGRQMTIRFNADIDSALPWDFKPEQPSVEVKVGEPTLVSYLAHNRSEKSVKGTAVFNVTPHKAGRYFDKIACFCFEEQTLAAGQTVHMPVQFYVDPAIMDDKNLDDVETITLSYTFFQVKP